MNPLNTKEYRLAELRIVCVYGNAGDGISFDYKSDLIADTDPHFIVYARGSFEFSRQDGNMEPLVRNIVENHSSVSKSAGVYNLKALENDSLYYCFSVDGADRKVQHETVKVEGAVQIPFMTAAVAITAGLSCNGKVVPAGTLLLARSDNMNVGGSGTLVRVWL